MQDITIAGNVTKDLAGELKILENSRKAVLNFTVCVNHKNTKTGEESTDFYQVVAWETLALNLASCITKGTRLIVEGRLKSRSYTTTEGNERTVWEITANSAGPDLRWATADVTKNPQNHSAVYNGESSEPTPAFDPNEAPF
jgi:single-strand DNA-binding protein